MKPLLLILAVVWSVVLLPIIVALLQKDMEDGIPWLAERLVRRAAARLPAEVQKRYMDEWLAELHAIPVRLVKLAFAIRLSFRSRATGREALGLPAPLQSLQQKLAEALAVYLSGDNKKKKKKRKTKRSGSPAIIMPRRQPNIEVTFRDDVVQITNTSDSPVGGIVLSLGFS